MRALARLNRSSSDTLDFDPVFYRTYYTDLQVLKSRRALLKHYHRHGRAEKRFPSLAAARAHFAALNGPTPKEFDVGLYRQLNPDLAKLLSDLIQYEMHFLEYGRFENRPFGAPTGRPEEAWQRLLNIYEFNLLNEGWLPEGGVGRVEALASMETEGIARLAPISRNWIFDPAFYRAQYCIEGGDAQLYREWLYNGFAAGRMPNEVRAIFGLVGGKPYPDNFDWKRYCKLEKVEVGSILPHEDPSARDPIRTTARRPRMRMRLRLRCRRPLRGGGKLQPDPGPLPRGLRGVPLGN